MNGIIRSCRVCPNVAVVNGKCVDHATEEELDSFLSPLVNEVMSDTRKGVGTLRTDYTDWPSVERHISWSLQQLSRQQAHLVAYTIAWSLNNNEPWDNGLQGTTVLPPTIFDPPVQVVLPPPKYVQDLRGFTPAGPSVLEELLSRLLPSAVQMVLDDTDKRLASAVTDDRYYLVVTFLGEPVTYAVASVDSVREFLRKQREV